MSVPLSIVVVVVWNTLLVGIAAGILWASRGEGGWSEED